MLVHPRPRARSSAGSGRGEVQILVGTSDDAKKSVRARVQADVPKRHGWGSKGSSVHLEGFLVLKSVVAEFSRTKRSLPNRKKKASQQVPGSK